MTDEELGLFWRDLEYSHWWYRAPIETQAMMIKAFHEVTQDFDAMEDAKVWLLKQKQTQDWKTTKATADACYALLLQGANLLASEALVEVTVGDQKIEPKKVEAGTGFYEHRFHTGKRSEAQLRQYSAQETRRRRRLGQRALAIHGRHLQGHPARGYPTEAHQAVLHQGEHR